MMRSLTVACLSLALLTTGAHAQRLQDRIDAVKRRDQQHTGPDAQQEQARDTLQIPAKMSRIIGEVVFDQTQARTVFNWWSSTTGVPMVIDWNAMELQGVDPEQPITMNLQAVPARLLLDVLIRQASPEVELIYEVTPWYVRVLTKRQANRHPVMRVYDVGGMTVQIPHFTDAPSFDLTEALSNTRSGGGGSRGIFTDSNGEGKNDPPNKTERGQNLADMIRNAIEPDIWQKNGGLFASVRYYNGRLIVNAPMYVHRQIGIPIAPIRTPVVAGLPEREVAVQDMPVN